MFPNYLLIFITFISYASSIIIKGQLELEDPSSERINTVTVSLIWGNKISEITENGEFFFNIDEPGYYLLQVNDNKFHYAPIYIDATDDEVKAYKYNYKYGKGQKIQYPVTIKSDYKIKYGEMKQNMLESIIKSPYFIMIGLGLMMFVCMKMIPQEELQKQQEEMRKNFGGGLGSFFNRN